MTRAKDISKIITDADFSGTLDVTGLATVGGLKLGHQNYISWADSGGTNRNVIQFDTDTLKIGVSGNVDNTIIRSNGADRIKADSNGDISFYEDTGTTPKLFWDSSAEGLGIGKTDITTTSAFTVQNTNNSTQILMSLYNANGNRNFAFRPATDGNPNLLMEKNDGTDTILLDTDGDSYFNGGNVGIGTSSPSTTLHVKSANPHFRLETTSAVASGGTVYNTLRDSTGSDVFLNGFAGLANCYQFATIFANGFMRFLTGNQVEAMRIDSSGRMLLGTTTEGEAGADDLTVATTGHTGITIRSGTSSEGSLYFSDGTSGADEYRGFVQYLHSSNSLRFGTDAAERMRINSSGDLLVGTTNPDVGGSVTGINLKQSGSILASTDETDNIGNAPYYGDRRGTNNTGDILGLALGGYYKASIGVLGTNTTANDGGITFNTISANATKTERVRIDSSGNVGIGGTSFNPKLYVLNSNAGPGLTAANATAVFHGSVDIGKGGCIGFDFGASHTNYPVGLGYVITSQAGSTKGDLAFFTRSVTTDTAPTERMRIDSSGNLLVGKTTDDNTTVGGAIRNTGVGSFVADGNHPLILNRKTSDGDILSFRKNGSVVGNISNSGTTLAIGNSLNAGIRFASTRFNPTSGGATDIDNSLDIGNTGARFDDIYATNGTIQTSDRNEKQDIEELSEAEQRVAVVAKGLMRKFRWIDSVAEKGDNARTHFGIIAQDLQDAFTAEGLDAGNYAMFIRGTWWELDGKTYDTEEEAPEGATQKTRLGVRYNQLLAFIISAI